MKCFYKECEVEIIAVYDSPAKLGLTPTVEIHCKKSDIQQWLTTKKSFSSPMDAELFGATMARKWIDENVK